MIKRIYIDNYKCLVNFELHLGEITLLVGPNGVGKSSVLDVIYALRRLLSGAAKVDDPDVFPPDSRTRWSSQLKQVVEVECDFDGEVLTYRLEIEHAESGRKTKVASETLRAKTGLLFSFVEGEVQLYRDDHGKGPQVGSDWSESSLARVPARPENSRLTRFRDYMRNSVVCGLYPRSFSTDSTREEPVLQRDGANFVSWYRHLVQEVGDTTEYRDALREVLDGFDKVRLEKVGTEARAMTAVFRQNGAPYELRLGELSDGQRAVVALYAFLHLFQESNAPLFLDEPDNYLALTEIQPWLIALADACGVKIPQAVICSHHPEVIDYLGGDRGVLLEREVTGVTKVRYLGDVELPDGAKLSELVARGWLQ
jgi:predicted ATPase